jgi:hypothetical protein
MKLIERIEYSIQHDKTIDQQLESLSQFDDLTEDDLLELTNHHKSSEVGILIEYLGYEKLKNHLPIFLAFLADANWPASGGTAKMLNQAKEQIIPEIKRVFKEVWSDHIWHYWILVLLISDWDRALIQKIKPELIDLISKGDKEGASIQALLLLKEKKLITKKEIEIHYQFLLHKYVGDKYWTDELKEEIIFD